MSSMPNGFQGAWRGQWPVFMCGFRPFFVLTAISGVLLIALWQAILAGWLRFNPYGGSLLWHGHELIYAFVGAAITGFVLTSVPEFTKTPAINGQVLVFLSILWCAARLAYALSGLWPAWIGLWPAALCNLVLWLCLLRLITPLVWRQEQRRHVSFALVLALLMLVQLGFFMAVARSANALAWLYLSVGLIMMLIIIAASRVSMMVVNGLIEKGKPDYQVPNNVDYLARPPRRNLAVVCIGICSLCEFIFGHDVITGWTALAASAAMLNLLNDWHIGRALFRRFALMLYVCYILMALAYALMGAAWLGAPWLVSSGRHVLMIGAMGLSIWTIMALVGRIHAGLWLDYRPWLMFGAGLLLLATILRALAGSFALLAWQPLLLLLSALLWITCFTLYGFKTWRTLTGERIDGVFGCAEPMERQH